MIPALPAAAVLFLAAVAVQFAAIFAHARFPAKFSAPWSEGLDKISWVLIALAIMAGMIAVLK